MPPPAAATDGQMHDGWSDLGCFGVSFRSYKINSHEICNELVHHFRPFECSLDPRYLKFILNHGTVQRVDGA